MRQRPKPGARRWLAPQGSTHCAPVAGTDYGCRIPRVASGFAARSGLVIVVEMTLIDQRCLAAFNAAERAREMLISIPKRSRAAARREERLEQERLDRDSHLPST